MEPLVSSRQAWTGRTADLVRPPIAEVNRLARELAATGRPIINLGQAIVGLAPPKGALRAVRDFLDNEPIHGYAPDPGLPELREAVARYCRERKGIAWATSDCVMITCGANQAFADVLMTVTRSGDEVITFGPGYFDHDYTLAMAGCSVVEVPLRTRHTCFEFAIDDVARAITPKTRCVVLVSPANPSAAVADYAFVRDLAELCRKRHLWLISDETYDLLVYPPAEHVSPGVFADPERVAIMGSFSKSLALAGWRVGYFLASPQCIEEAVKAQDAMVVCAPVPSQWAALAGLAELDSYVPAAIAELEARRDALVRALAGCPLVQPMTAKGATFLLARMVTGDDDVAFCKSMLLQTGVVTVPGSAFGPCGRGYVRFSFGNQPVDRIVEAGRLLAEMG